MKPRRMESREMLSSMEKISEFRIFTGESQGERAFNVTMVLVGG
jgi:hypothetical protein